MNNTSALTEVMIWCLGFIDTTMNEPQFKPISLCQIIPTCMLATGMSLFRH